MNSPQIREQLLALSSRQDAGDALYALIDLANLAADQSAALRLLKAKGAVNVLFDDRKEAELACPWLLRLSPDTPGQDMVKRTIQWALQSACVMWLRCGLSPSLLAHALYQRTRAELPDHHAIMMRMYDPRVLPELARVLADDPQANGYWAVAQEWLFLDRQQQLASLKMHPDGDPAAFDPPLRLNQSQADSLLAAAEVDRVMPELVRASPEAFLALPADERLNITRKALKMADHHGLEAHADRVTMSVLCVELGMVFTQQAPWKDALLQMQSGRLSFAQAVQQALTT